MVFNPDDYKLNEEQKLNYDKIKLSFYHFHRKFPSLTYYGNIPAQYSENTVSWIQWMHWVEGWIKTINDNQEQLNADFNEFVKIFNQFLDDLPDYIREIINDYLGDMVVSQEVTEVDVNLIVTTDFEKTGFSIENVKNSESVTDDDYVYNELLPEELIMIGA